MRLTIKRLERRASIITGSRRGTGVDPRRFREFVYAVVAGGLLAGIGQTAQGGETARTQQGVGELLVVTPNQFQGTDVERINQAIDAAVKLGCRAVIPRVNVQGEERREVWLLDSAILVRSNAALEPRRDQSNKKPASVRG